MRRGFLVLSAVLLAAAVAVAVLARRQPPERFGWEPVTAVMLTYARPHNLAETLPPLLAAPAVAQVVVSHGDRRTLAAARAEVAKLADPRVVLYDDAALNDTIGVLRRFTRAADAKTRLVLILDDDIVVSRPLVARMAAEAAKPGMLPFVGPVRRACNAAGYATDLGRTGAPHDTILTGLVVVSRDLVRLFLANKHLVEDLVADRTPRWNGEDVSFNYVVRALTGATPRFVAGEFRWVGKEVAAIHRLPGHYEERDALCRQLAARLD